MSKAKNIFRKYVGPRLGVLRQYPPQSLNLHRPHSNGVGLSTVPRISIVTPSYNQGEFIGRTVQSILAQKYENLEYFIQDGGSIDDTIAVVRGYEDRVTGWAAEPDKGQSNALNKAFAKTTGDIMGWLNSDDLLLPNALEVVADQFNRNPDVDVIYGNRLIIDENDMEVGRWILPGHSSRVLDWADYIPQETMFWRRRIWDRSGASIDESFRFAMDWDLLTRFREAGARFLHVPLFLGAFRVHSNQKTSAEIADIGIQEMNRIRMRTLGRIPSLAEIHRAVGPFLLAHIAMDIVFRLSSKSRKS